MPDELELLMCQDMRNRVHCKHHKQNGTDRAASLPSFHFVLLKLLAVVELL